MKNKNRKYIIGMFTASLLIGGTENAAAQESVQDTIAAICRVNVEQLKVMPDIQLSNSLEGMASGLIIRQNTGDLGNAKASIYIRGQHNNGSSGAIVIIDGIQRELDDILPEEIESIEVLKDAPAKILYGERAANGVIVIRTKRGKANERNINLSLEYGVQSVTRMPEFLDAYNYATLFNEACLNDGLQPYYSDTDLQGYKNSKGVNDLLYPNVNYYDEFLRSSINYRRATFEVNGGNDRAQYNVFVGYSGNSGLEKVGDRSDINRLNARGNLDIKINDFLKVSADVAARIEKKDWGGKDLSSLFGEISTLRPNEYPFMISAEDLTSHGITINEDTNMYFGASTRKNNNVYQEVMYGGNHSERYVNSQTNLGINLDLNEYVEGLTANAYVTFDNYSYLRQSLSNTYPTYSIERYLNENGDTEYRFTERKRLELGTSQGINSNDTRRLFGWNADVNYRKNFNDLHDLSLRAAYRYNMHENSGNQDMKEGNFAFTAQYGYDKKYIVEATAAAMGSNLFQDGNKYFFAYSAAAAWNISKESFMEDLEWVNNLELRASYGHLGYAGNLGHTLYKTDWTRNGTDLDFSTTTGNVTTAYIHRWGNPDLDWEYSNEFNVGLEGLFLNNRLSAEVNYFHEMRKNIIGTNSKLYAAVAGSYLPQENIGEVMNQGFDASFRWADRVNNDFSYNVGVNLTYSKNELRKSGDLTNIEEYRRAIGKPTSTIFGLEALGLFGKDVDINSHVLQSYGNYTVGDIAYANLNGDDLIDDNDQTSIGQSFPTTTLGIDFTLNYKGFSLYVLGTAATGVTQMLTNNYFRNYGMNGYSILALDRYHPINNPDGIQPRLTTTEAVNNNRNSTFWSEDGSYFRLKNVELSYTWKPNYKISKEFKFFVRGANLFVLSAIKDVDPAMINAGISNSPAYRTFTGGLSINF